MNGFDRAHWQTDVFLPRSAVHCLLRCLGCRFSNCYGQIRLLQQALQLAIESIYRVPVRQNLIKPYQKN